MEESMLALAEVEQRETSSSYGLKLVPWMSWDEWLFVYRSLFSQSPLSVASALTRISTWRSRGCLPVTVEVTASIVEIQRREPQVRKGRVVDASDENRAEQCTEASLSEEMLAMLYCMAIMRLVNGVVEKTRKQREVSIAVAADAIGLPRTLIDIRHEGSHRELPALQVVRSAAAKALDWLISYYWEPQKKAIPFQGDSTTKTRKGIESELQELSSCLKAKDTSQSSSPVKAKRYKKQITKILKNLVGLYSSCSSQVVSVVLDFLLKALNSPISMKPSVEPLVDPSADALLEDWKPVMKKFSHKEPELIVSLLQTVLDMIEIQENMKYETGRKRVRSADSPDVRQIEHLSSLFTWLIRNLKQLKPRQCKDSSMEMKSSSAESIVPKAILTQLLRRCLMLSASGNKLLMNSTACIVRLIGEDHLLKKLNKLSSLVSSNSEIINDDSLSLINSKNLNQQDEFISLAAKKLELIKTLRRKRKAGKIKTDADTGSSRRWAIAETWNPCPIGMLPNSVGSSGCLPVLDYKDGPKKIPETSQAGESPDSIRYEETTEPPPNGVQELHESSLKKIRTTIEQYCEYSGSANSHLLIGGVWRKVGEEDLLAIKSSVRILV